MLREFPERRHEEPCKPDALAFAVNADAIHSVVPVTCANERQSVFTKRARFSERLDAMVIDCVDDV